MKVLVIYGTVEGQSAKIAQFVADTAAELGHEAELLDAEAPTVLDMQAADAVVLTASVHQRRHPAKFEALVAGNTGELGAKKTLLLSVSLSAAFPEGLEEAQDYVTEMKMRTGLQPDVEMLVAGALRIDRYDYFAMQVLRHVVLRDRDHDLGAGAHEFTDWDALRAKLSDFLKPS